MKRREFVKIAAAAIPAVTIVPRHVLGRGFVAPSDKLNIAAIGVGGKGWGNLSRSHESESANITALCDVDDTMAVRARQKWKKANYYRDYRKMLDAEGDGVDAVIVSSPDHMHAVQALEAMKRGKHVYCEKPLTHDIHEARILTEAAEKYKVVTQMGNQGSSGDDTRYVESWIRSGFIGDVHKVHVWTNRPVWPQGVPAPNEVHRIPDTLDWDLWLGTAPFRDFHQSYIPAKWRGWVDFGTGALGDMGCHFMDVPYRALKLGYPVSAYCSVAEVWKGFFELADPSGSYPPASRIHIQFPAREGMPELELIWYDGGILPERPVELLPDEAMGEWDGGMIFEGSKGKLMAGLFGRKPTLLPTSDMKDVPLPEPSSPLVKNGSDGHQAQWVEACKEGFGAYTSSPFSQAGPLTETVLMGNLAVLSFMISKKRDGWPPYSHPGRKKLLWDGDNMEITNFKDANQFVKRAFRGEWGFKL